MVFGNHRFQQRFFFKGLLFCNVFLSGLPFSIRFLVPWEAKTVLFFIFRFFVFKAFFPSSMHRLRNVFFFAASPFSKRVFARLREGCRFQSVFSFSPFFRFQYVFNLVGKTVFKAFAISSPSPFSKRFQLFAQKHDENGRAFDFQDDAMHENDENGKNVFFRAMPSPGLGLIFSACPRLSLPSGNR